MTVQNMAAALHEDVSEVRRQCAGVVQQMVIDANNMDERRRSQGRDQPNGHIRS